MPWGKLGIAVQEEGDPPVRILARAPLTSATCKPSLNGLQMLIGFENGPFAVPFIPSGKNGRARKPIARLLNANFPSRNTPSTAAASTNLPKPAARNCAPAVGRLKKFAVRAFCAATSNPKGGASIVLNAPSTAPLVSTTKILTSTGEGTGRRIAARIRYAACAPCVRMRVTSLTVRLETALPLNGKNRGSTRPGTWPSVKNENREAGCARIGNITVPARFAKGCGAGPSPCGFTFT